MLPLSDPGAPHRRPLSSRQTSLPAVMTAIGYNGNDERTNAAASSGKEGSEVPVSEGAAPPAMSPESRSSGRSRPASCRPGTCRPGDHQARGRRRRQAPRAAGPRRTFVPASLEGDVAAPSARTGRRGGGGSAGRTARRPVFSSFWPDRGPTIKGRACLLKHGASRRLGTAMLGHDILVVDSTQLLQGLELRRRPNSSAAWNMTRSVDHTGPPVQARPQRLRGPGLRSGATRGSNVCGGEMDSLARLVPPPRRSGRRAPAAAPEASLGSRARRARKHAAASAVEALAGALPRP